MCINPYTTEVELCDYQRTPQSPSWDDMSAAKEILNFMETKRSMTGSTSACNFSAFWARSVHFTPFQSLPSTPSSSQTSLSFCPPHQACNFSPPYVPHSHPNITFHNMSLKTSSESNQSVFSYTETGWSHVHSVVLTKVFNNNNVHKTKNLLLNAIFLKWQSLCLIHRLIPCKVWSTDDLVVYSRHRLYTTAGYGWELQWNKLVADKIDVYNCRPAKGGW
jgi:hypothetical protein